MFNIKDIKFTANTQSSNSYNIGMHKSYVPMALKEMASINEANLINTRNLAKAIVNGEPIEEATKIFTIATTVLIDQTLLAMQNMTKVFTKELNDFFKDRKEFQGMVETLADKTDTFNKFSFNTKGFYYTEMKQPNILLASEFKKGFVELTCKPLENVYNNLYVVYHDKYMDKIRKSTLNTTSLINEKNLKDKVYEFFRNNSTEESVVIYTQSDLEDMILKYIKPTMYIENITDLYNDIDEQCKEVKRCIELLSKDLCTMSTINQLVYGKTDKSIRDDEIVPQGFNDAVMAILKLKTNFIPAYMQLYLLIFSGKLDAIKKSIYQNSAVLDSFYNFVFSKQDEEL